MNFEPEIHITEYEKLKALLKLLSQLTKREQSGRENGWLDIDQVEALLEQENG